jgi:hypothetical protein
MEVTSPFSFIASINSSDKTNLMETCPEGRSQYVPFIINRSLSYHEDMVFIVNEMNAKHRLPHEMQYDFLRMVTRPRKRFSKWIKPTTDEDEATIASYYKISIHKARSMAHLLKPSDIAEMKDVLDVGGVR